jgi:hypothetical protein
MQSEMALQGTHCRRQLETALVDLAIKKQGLVIDTAFGCAGYAGPSAGIAAGRRGAHGLARAGHGKAFDARMTQGAESHAAKVKQMNQKPEARRHRASHDASGIPPQALR